MYDIFGGESMDKRRDMTVGAEWKELLLFSLPIMAGQFLQQLYNTVDSRPVVPLLSGGRLDRALW